MSSKRSERGFTLVEFMIATGIFSMVLLVILAAITQISRVYTKGVITARTQQAARSVLDTMTQQLQYLDGSPQPVSGVSLSGDGTPGALCIGSRRYSIVTNRQVSSGNPVTTERKQKHAIWADTAPAVGCPAVTGMLDSDKPTGGAADTELLPEGMRIVNLEVSRVGSSAVWKVAVKIVYGPDDLLESASGGAQASSPSTTVCISAVSGSQYCAISELQTLVERRIQ